MTMRLLLALLMILSAPLAAAQHLGCAQPAVAEAASDSHAHHAMASADHHDHSTVEAAVSEPAEDCDSCDLACQAACASVAMPASLTDALDAADHSTPDLAFAADLLLSHPLPLLRPPTLATA